LFGQTPAHIACDIVSSAQDGLVDISFSASLIYPGGASLIGFFSLGTVYRNSLSIIGERYACDAERIFTPPADYQGVVTVSRNNARENVGVARGDTFAAFLDDVIQGIAGKTQATFAEVLVQDATVLEQMRMAAGLIPA
jgi:hypothetical protein